MRKELLEVFLDEMERHAKNTHQVEKDFEKMECDSRMRADNFIRCGNYLIAEFCEVLGNYEPTDYELSVIISRLKTVAQFSNHACLSVLIEKLYKACGKTGQL